MNDRSDDDDVLLELAKTRLRVAGGELQRLNKNEGVALRIPVDTIDSVEYRAKFDAFSLVFPLAAVGLWAVGYFVAQNNVVDSLLYAAAVMLAAFGLLAVRTDQIIVRSAAGVTRIQCNDQADEAEGFVTSLRGKLRTATARL